MTEIDRQLRRRLEALPLLAPPPGLGERIAKTCRARAARRRSGLMGVTMLALACIVAAPLLSDREDPKQLPTPAPALDVGRLADLQALDHALQVAYERHATEDETAPLWAARAQLLAGLPPPATI